MDRYRGRKPSLSYSQPRRRIDLYDSFSGAARWLKANIHDIIFNTRGFSTAVSRSPRRSFSNATRWLARRAFSIPNLLALIWIIILYEGEHTIFDQSIEACDWPTWEQWPDRATPHRIAFITDPQLVDPHTYPGRPWPLSTLTMKHTDLYLRRSYSRIRRELDPHTIIFLGDMFDGGREWSTRASQSPEERWRKYGDDFWKQEYTRFSNIFFEDWETDPDAAAAGKRQTGKTRTIASLPGNHDIGFGTGVQLPVRERFQAFFGDSNRIDIIGNHTFVSVDSVSLSANDQEGSDENIWGPAMQFLNGAADAIKQEVDHHIKHKEDRHLEGVRHAHLVEETDNSIAEQAIPAKQISGSADFPTILLTHVPLHRTQGTPCGPLRERRPPSIPPPGQKGPVNPDNPNSLTIDGGWGYQYRNFVSPSLSSFILESLQGKVSRVFSGDDHDYCEVVHRAYPSPGKGVREITVKSISWAMGVRKPGFLLASLWNEVDNEGKRLPGGEGQREQTMQTHLCLLPDQLSIFLRYAWLIGISVLVLLAHIIYSGFISPRTTSGDESMPLLPIFGASMSSAEREKANGSASPMMNGNASQHADTSSMSEQSTNSPSVTRGRSGTATRPRSISPMPTYGYGIGNAVMDPVSTYPPSRDVRNGTARRPDYEPDSRQREKGARRKKSRHYSVTEAVGEFVQEFGRVALVAILWYSWLLYS